jgi:hypothetical protein
VGRSYIEAIGVDISGVDPPVQDSGRWSHAMVYDFS